jgi:hypothetical protein
MRQGMQVVKNRFQEEFRKFPGMPRSALIIVSDGESTDGLPTMESREMQHLGTTVVGAYLTSNDVAGPKKRYDKPLDSWPDGARTLFEMSSPVGEDGTALALLQAKGWEASFESRLFIQLNQSQIMSEFMSAILEIEAHGRDQQGMA